MDGVKLRGPRSPLSVMLSGPEPEAAWGAASIYRPTVAWLILMPSLSSSPWMGAKNRHHDRDGMAGPRKSPVFLSLVVI